MMNRRNSRTWTIVPNGILLKTVRSDASSFLEMEISRLLWICAYNLNLRNTCAFDSIFHVVISGILSSRLYREKITSTKCPMIQLCYNVIGTKKLTAKHYKLRTESLKKIAMFEIQNYTRKIKSHDVKFNAAHLAQIILYNNSI